MTIKKDINLGTLIPVILFMVGQTVAFVMWVINESHSQALNAAVIAQQLTEMRDWQERQDDKIVLITETQSDLARQQASIVTLLEFFKDEWESESE